MKGIQRSFVESLVVARAKLTSVVETHAKLASFAINELIVELEAAVREDERDIIAAAARKVLETAPVIITAPIAGVAPEHAFKPTGELPPPNATHEPLAPLGDATPPATGKKKQKHK